MKTTLLPRWLVKLLCALLLACGALDHAAACVTGACVSAGPRLASVNSTRGALLNLLLGNLTGSTLTLSVADWNSLATGNVSLASTLSALQTTLNASTPSAALNANATLAQVIAAAASAATGEGKTTLATALNNLKLPLQLLGGTIRLGDLLTSDGALGTTRVNALELVTGAIQLYNTKNVLSTPSAITVSGASLGLTGIATSVTLAAQVVEAPVFVCGPVGTTFHSATIRVKLSLELLSLSIDVAVLKLIPGVGSLVSAQVGHLDLYLEVARADGVISSINAIANSFSVQATPGVADIYLGLADDSVFFNRNRALSAADFDWSTIGSLTVALVTVDLRAKASARGGAGSPTTLNFSGTYPQGGTASAGAAFVTNLISTLMGNLQVSLSAGLGGLSATLTLALQPLVQLTLPGTLQTLVTSLVNPTLELLGVRLGEVDVNAGGTVFTCTISGSVYEDVNHTAKLEYGETGTGVALYAKLVPSGTPAGPALAVATVDPTTGAYTFSGVTAASYLVVVNTSASASQVTGAAPSGWIGTETPTLSLAATLTNADLTARRFGLYHGSKLGGTLFKDNGGGGGTANNGVRDGTETALVGASIKLTDAAGSIVYDSTTSGDSGAYTVWIPYAAGAGTLKVAHAASAEWVAVSGQAGTTGGVYAQLGASVAFTHASGSVYTGVNFGDVPAPRFEPDGQQQVLPGGVVFFAHTFTAGSAGQLTITATGTAPAGATGWSAVLYADTNCNGKLDAGETPLTAATSVVADQKLCVVVKVAAPSTAALNAQYPVALAAHFGYANNTLASDHARADLVTVGSHTSSGLRLAKAVDKASATIGDTLTYTLTYTNQSDAALGGLKIVDATPAYTVFVSAACGAVPNASISCAVSLAPAVGGVGKVEWTFTGSLVAGGVGTVSFSVVVQ